jgi:hypothetical protein
MPRMATRAKVTARYPTPEEIENFLKMPKERAQRLAADVLSVRQSALEKSKPSDAKRGNRKAKKK